MIPIEMIIKCGRHGSHLLQFNKASSIPRLDVYPLMATRGPRVCQPFMIWFRSAMAKTPLQYRDAEECFMVSSFITVLCLTALLSRLLWRFISTRFLCLSNLTDRITTVRHIWNFWATAHCFYEPPRAQRREKIPEWPGEPLSRCQQPEHSDDRIMFVFRTEILRSNMQVGDVSPYFQTGFLT